MPHLSYTDRVASLTSSISVDAIIACNYVPGPPASYTAKTRDEHMDTVLIIIVLLLLFGGGGGLYWGLGAGWGIGPVGLIVAVVVVAFLLNSRRGRL